MVWGPYCPLTLGVAMSQTVTWLLGLIGLLILTFLCVSLHASDIEAEMTRRVEAAFARLPAPAGAHFGIVEASVSGEVATVAAVLPGGSGDAELFVAGSEGYVFGIPRKNGSAPGEIVFTLPILEEPKSGGAATIAYTLVSGGASVSGDFRLP